MLIRPTLIALAATLATSFSASAQPLNIEFDEGIDSWRIVLDGVMGGRSTGQARAGDPSTMVFTGTLSLENNGGFSQIRKNIDEGTLANQDGLEIKVLGDGRTYQFDIRVSNARLMAGGFQTTFDTYPGEWKTIKLPFDDFRLYSFGRLVRNAPELDPALIESIGVTIADKNAGAFRIEVDSIASYSTDQPAGSRPAAVLASPAQLAGSADQDILKSFTPPAPSERLDHEAVRLYDLAINRGVELFNSGQREACAYVYEIAIESMIALGADKLDLIGIVMLQKGLAEAESEHDWTERAWIYRRALDSANTRFRSVQ